MLTRNQSRQQSYAAATPKIKATKKSNKTVVEIDDEIYQFISCIRDYLIEFEMEKNYNNKVILITKIYSKINDEITDLHPRLQKYQKGNKLFLTIYDKFIELKDDIKNSQYNNLVTIYDKNLLNECMVLLEKTREKLIPIFKNLKNAEKYISENIIKNIEKDVNEYEKSYYLRPYKIIDYNNTDENCDIPGDEDYINRKIFDKKEVKNVVSLYLNRLRNNMKKVDYCELDEDELN